MFARCSRSLSLFTLSLLLRSSSSAPLGIGSLRDLLEGALDTVSSTGIVGSLEGVLNSIGVGNSLANPLLETLDSLLKGNGLIDGALGALQGVLGEEQTFDYVVVGGGTGGNAIGVRLAEAGYSVAIIEAGLDYAIAKPVLASVPVLDIVGIGSSMLDSIPTIDWEFQTQPQAGANNRKFHYARGKCLGGTSALNFMVYHRGSEGSYAKWAEEVGDGSYKYDDFQQYFKKSVTLTPPDNEKRPANVSTVYDADAYSSPGGPVQVGYTNWVATWSTWLEAGLKAVGMERTTGFSSGQLLGYHYSQSTIRASDQTRSTSCTYIFDADDATQKNLKVYTQTLGRKVLFNGNNTATGVQVNSLGIDYKINARKEVIVSAGAFQSPQLLMVSGIGPKEELAKFDIPLISELPGVGQNMWDHIMFGPTYQVKFDTLDRFMHDPTVLASNLAEYILNQDGVLTSNVVEFLGWEKLPEKYRSSWSPETVEAMNSFPSDWPEVEHISGNGYIGDFWFPALQQPLDNNQYATDLGAIVAPMSRGNVTLKSASTFDLPLVNPNWLTHKADQEVAVSWYRRMREVWQTPELQSIIINATSSSQEYYPGDSVQTDAEILEIIRESLMTVWHASCTCKMGKATDPMAVVDSKARVFGVQGLRVVDGSALPFLPPGHPQSTIYALAEKIADSIIKG
jgi:choline dehydrogenase